MNKETRTYRSEMRMEAEGNTVAGYAALYNSRSEEMFGFVEEIEPGAFDDTDVSDVRALFNHDPNLLLARTTSGTLRLERDVRGLRYEFEIPDTNAGRDLRELLRRGDVSQSSFGFTIEDQAWEERDGIPVRKIKKIKRLFDVSPVTYPAYPDTQVALRSLEQWKAEHNKTEVKEKTPLRDAAEALII